MKNKSPSILIVDDNIDNIQVLGSTLKPEGYQLEFATEGIAALDLINNDKFDLILLDINMPGINGFEVCSRIKGSEATKDLPVIFITANTDKESLINGFNAGGVDYITKPFLKHELLARVKTQLNMKKARDNIESYAKEIETKNKNIQQSVNYAGLIQHALFRIGKCDYVFLPESFILFLPKEIIGGDFYRFYETDRGFISAVMDCTGHGVPGALMSVLGVTLIDEIVLQDKILRPDLILNRLTEKLMLSLDQNEGKTFIRDGIEGLIINFNRDSFTLSFSGSFNNLLILREREIIEIIADKISIGYGLNKPIFRHEEVAIRKGDCVYLFSDGYADQFGGVNNKKFMVKRFKELLLDISHESMIKQKELLLDTLINWGGDIEQTDDIIVIGYRF